MDRIDAMKVFIGVLDEGSNKETRRDA